MAVFCLAGNSNYLKILNCGLLSNKASKSKINKLRPASPNEGNMVTILQVHQLCF